MQKFSEFVALVEQSNGAVFGDATLVRVLEGGEGVLFVGEQDPPPASVLPHGTDILVAFATENTVGLVCTGELADSEVQELLGALPTREGFKAFRMAGDYESHGALRVYTSVGDALREAEIDLTGVESPTVIFDNDGAPLVTGFDAEGRLVRQPVMLNSLQRQRLAPTHSAKYIQTVFRSWRTTSDSQSQVRTDFPENQ